MPAIEHINPPGLLQLDAFSQVVVVSGGRTAYIAGQGAFDQNMKLIGPNDLHAQTVQAFRNLRTALAALGVGPERVVSSTMYVVDLDDAKAGILVAAMNVALDGAWTTNYGVDGKADGDNYKFTMAADGTVEYTFDPESKLLTITTK